MKTRIDVSQSARILFWHDVFGSGGSGHVDYEYSDNRNEAHCQSHGLIYLCI